MSEKLPKQLLSIETGAPFTHCVQCNCELQQEGLIYAIEKVIQQDEVVYEYALCEKCMYSIYDDLSEESRTAMQHYMVENIKAPGSFDHCSMCKTPTLELPTFNQMAYLEGYEFCDPSFPIISCESCLAPLQEKISTSTRDRLDRFKHENFPDPPGMEVPSPDDVMILI